MINDILASHTSEGPVHMVSGPFGPYRPRAEYAIHIRNNPNVASIMRRAVELPQALLAAASCDVKSWCGSHGDGPPAQSDSRSAKSGLMPVSQVSVRVPALVVWGRSN